jgi:hypothetical protein
MNQRDLDNIRFLVNCTPEQLREWYNSADDGDLIYASHIMDVYAQYLENEIAYQHIEKQISDMPVMLEAQAVIAMVRN